MVLISTIIAPTSAPQALASQPPPAPRLDDVDRSIIKAIREQGPVKLWSLLNWLADDEGAQSRAEARKARLDLWERIKRLKRLKVIFGVGRNEIAATKPVREPARQRRPRRRRESTAGRLTHVQAVSAVNSRSLLEQPTPTYPVGVEAVQENVAPGTAPEKLAQTKSDGTVEERKWKPFSFDRVFGEIKGDLQRAEISAVASWLAQQPRGQTSRWSGYLNPKDKRTRLWRGRLVLTPDNRMVNALGSKCGLVMVYWDDPQCVEGRQFQVFKAEQIRVLKLAAAVHLGGLKKGVRERPSTLKKVAARLNGCQPCAPGKRRGRPRKPIHPTTPDARRNLPPIGPMPCTLPAMDFASAVAFYSRPQPPQSPAPTA
jgi:hypothetical protein